MKKLIFLIILFLIGVAAFDVLCSTNDKEFAEKCFELLKESVAPEAYNKFFANFRFVKIDGEEFVFETGSQEVYDEVFDTDRHDEVGDRLIELAMSLDKKINGWGVYLVNK